MKPNWNYRRGGGGGGGVIGVMPPLGMVWISTETKQLEKEPCNAES